MFGMSKITIWFSGIHATWSHCSKTDVPITVMHYNRATSGKRLLQDNIWLYIIYSTMSAFCVQNHLNWMRVWSVKLSAHAGKLVRTLEP